MVRTGEQQMSDPIIKPAIPHHISHGLGQHLEGHAVKGNIARDGAPKRATVVKINGGMAKQMSNGFRAAGGDHASALDSLSGVTVPAGKTVSTPSWGNATARSGNPTVHAPVGKRLAPVKPSWGMKSQSASGRSPTDLGEAILNEAFANADAATRAAHGRK
jgi:hypothetical protein